MPCTVIVQGSLWKSKWDRSSTLLQWDFSYDHSLVMLLLILFTLNEYCIQQRGCVLLNYEGMTWSPLDNIWLDLTRVGMKGLRNQLHSVTTSDRDSSGDNWSKVHDSSNRVRTASLRLLFLVRVVDPGASLSCFPRKSAIFMAMYYPFAHSHLQLLWNRYYYWFPCCSLSLCSTLVWLLSSS
jgi:hypothetical protein